MAQVCQKAKAAKVKLADLQAQLEEAHTQVTGMSTQLAQSKVQLTTAHENVTRLHAQLEEEQGQLSQALMQTSTVHEELLQGQRQLEELRAKGSQFKAERGEMLGQPSQKEKQKEELLQSQLGQETPQKMGWDEPHIIHPTTAQTPAREMRKEWPGKAAPMGHEERPQE